LIFVGKVSMKDGSIYPFLSEQRNWLIYTEKVLRARSYQNFPHPSFVNKKEQNEKKISTCKKILEVGWDWLWKWWRCLTTLIPSISSLAFLKKLFLKNFVKRFSSIENEKELKGISSCFFLTDFWIQRYVLREFLIPK